MNKIDHRPSYLNHLLHPSKKPFWTQKWRWVEDVSPFPLIDFEMNQPLIFPCVSLMIFLGWLTVVRIGWFLSKSSSSGCWVGFTESICLNATSAMNKRPLVELYMGSASLLTNQLWKVRDLRFFSWLTCCFCWRLIWLANWLLVGAFWWMSSLQCWTAHWRRRCAFRWSHMYLGREGKGGEFDAGDVLDLKFFSFFFLREKSVCRR